MRSLFLKIFLWFWLAMMLMAATIIVSALTTQSGPVMAQWRQASGRALALYGQTATEIFHRDGQPALLAYFERLDQSAGIRAFLFNERGEEVSGRAAPSDAPALAACAKESGQTEVKFLRRTPLVAQSVLAPGGYRYVLAGEMPPVSWDAIFGETSVRRLRLIALLMIAGVVCYGLARYLTGPILKLRAATRQLASGDLTVRVGAAVGKRRDEIADLARDFDLMAERVESLMTAQRRLLSDISHELRSPLARLNVALGLARQRAGADASGALDRIEREAERLNALIGQLLTLARLESGADAMEKGLVNLAALVHEIAADADFEARSHNRAVRMVASEECTTTGNVELIRRAIENVVRNAVRYTAEGTEVEITLRVQRDGNSSYATICVRDHGAGVPEAALADLFRPFYRVADARERQTGGIGLGLAITERSVRLHGGTVTAANAPNGGLIVEIHLPTRI
jgi:two-component system sensor histidine kinase CpxA